ncbi:hypothetical protein LWI29_029312 [Acer saccharum]|uniref:CRAL-TRIO domain-containing protein n=1 Tax=Acer saccharum TaxID=4024 RepID=A0AA39W6S4_ACESA|nr:hypothetical protein LWI29_029312 [Acer saccharum]
MCPPISDSDQEQLISKLDIFKIHGRVLSVQVLKKYLEEKVYPRLARKPFSVLYLHTGVQRSENFLGISALRSVYDSIPVNVKDNLRAVYFVHPGLQARLFLATFGRFFFDGGLYGKLKYVNRVDYLWEHVRRNEVEIPEFVIDHDEDLEYRPMMDYGLESDHPRVYGAPAVDSPSLSTYSTRCIS